MEHQFVVVDDRANQEVSYRQEVHQLVLNKVTLLDRSAMLFKLFFQQSEVSVTYSAIQGYRNNLQKQNYYQTKKTHFFIPYLPPPNAEYIQLLIKIFFQQCFKLKLCRNIDELNKISKLAQESDSPIKLRAVAKKSRSWLAYINLSYQKISGEGKQMPIQSQQQSKLQALNNYIKKCQQEQSVLLKEIKSRQNILMTWKKLGEGINQKNKGNSSIQLLTNQLFQVEKCFVQLILQTEWELEQCLQKQSSLMTIIDLINCIKDCKTIMHKLSIQQINSVQKQIQTISNILMSINKQDFKIQQLKNSYIQKRRSLWKKISL